jgi:hypothetical protein
MARQKQDAPDLGWRTMIRLTPEYGEKVERMAAREAVPVATVCRRLIMDQIDELERRQEQRQ